MADVKVITNEPERGCGFRQQGGLYLMSGALSESCGMLPLALSVCPCCGQGIKPARGWTWVDGAKLVENEHCPHNLVNATGPDVNPRCAACPMWQAERQVGLIWVGEKFYKTPNAFLAEAREMGISRRITTVPRDFVLGETWVWLAHRKAIERFEENEDGELEQIQEPGVIAVFQPTAIEYVVKHTETDEELTRMEKRGITPVDLRRDWFDGDPAEAREDFMRVEDGSIE